MTDRRGITLPIVLWIILLASAMSLEVVRQSRQTARDARTAIDAETGRAAAESAVQLSAWEIERRLNTTMDSHRGEAMTGIDIEEVVSPREIVLGAARASAVVVDPAKRLDVNSATVSQLERLLVFVAPPEPARRTAAAIRGAVEATADPRTGAIAGVRSLDALLDVQSVDREALTAAAPYLTVDGSGRVSRHAPAPVRASAGGDLVDRADRVLVVARGWRTGSAMTTEIQALYAVAQEPQGVRLLLLRSRESSR